MLSNWVQKILQATVYDVAIKTPLESAPKLSKRFDNHIRLKREDMQPVFSFKLRGAYNRISQLSDEQKACGVICASAGNHAQGVAYSASKLGLNNVIVMPVTTPDIKVEAVKALGGNVVLYGDAFDASNAHAMQLAEQKGLTYVPPYDDELVIAGQGTIAMELLQDWRDIDYVFVAVGGGGLIAGVAAFLGAIAPHVTVVAVEPDSAACLKAAMHAGERVRLNHVGIFVDGVAVAQIGELPFAVIRSQKSDGTSPLIDPEVVTCTNDEVCAAVKDVFDETRSVAEPAGALAVAGMKKYLKQHAITGKNCVAIVCGANMNFDRLRYIAERTEIGEKKEAIFAVSIPERTGAFLDFCRALKGRSITEFNYRARNNTTPDTGEPASIFVGIALKEGEAERQTIVQILQDEGYKAHDLTDDEIAKTHIRYLIGGHAGIDNEQLFTVTFPERPGALQNFLETLGQDFNITLFHYRNHGAADGRVLVGLQASSTNSRTIADTLQEIGYHCQPVDDNMGYEMFLR